VCVCLICTGQYFDNRKVLLDALLCNGGRDVGRLFVFLGFEEIGTS
jgi:hypothetical protein